MLKLFKRNIILYLFLISAFAAFNVFSLTNDVVTDYQKQLDEITKTYDSQWDVLTKNADSQWDVLTKNADKITTTISAGEEKQKLLDKLMKRIEDKTDSLDYLNEYESLLTDSVTAHLIYGTAYDMIKAGDTKHSFKLFNFLINTNNPNGFSVGCSYYWRGVILEDFYHNTDAAFNAYLQVHAYPSCLVYTDDSYIRAARICRFQRKRDTALALYSIRIPQIDYYKNEIRKVFASIDIARETKDLANRVRQVMRADEIARAKPKYEKIAENLYQELCAIADTNTIANISANLAKTEPFDSYTMKTIIRALTGPDAATNNPALEDMLLHDWPLMENVAEMHPEILTNRTLSNNIFKQKRRNILKNYEF